MKFKKDLKKALMVILGILLAQSHALASPNLGLLQGHSYANGADFCTKNPAQTCVPVYNNSNSSLYVTFQGNTILPSPLSAHEVAVYFDNESSLPGTMVTVYQKQQTTMNIIFAGFTKHNVGLTCTTDSCSEWE